MVLEIQMCEIQMETDGKLYVEISLFKYPRNVFMVQN